MNDDRFRLVIKITKGDETGQVLDRMYSGTVIGYDDFQKAVDALNEFVRLANLVIPGGKFRNYGVVCITDERDGCCHCVESLYCGENAR
jgi:hypothetical protein